MEVEEAVGKDPRQPGYLWILRSVCEKNFPEAFWTAVDIEAKALNDCNNSKGASRVTGQESPDLGQQQLGKWATVILYICLSSFQRSSIVTEQGQGVVVHDKLLQKGFRLSVSGGSFPHAHLLGLKCPPPEERRLSMPETGEKERNCLF